MRHLFFVPAIVTVLGLSACSTFDGDKIDYAKAVSAPSIVIPPDLSQFSTDNRYALPNGAVSASSMSTVKQSLNLAVSPQEAGDARIMRQGDKRWILVNRSAESLWTPTQEFWQSLGLKVDKADAKLGIMETEWAENRAQVSSGFIGRTLNRLLRPFIDTGTRDLYRTRLERIDANQTEIYITHRGIEEVFQNASNTSTAWREAAAQPELEIEMLRRLLLKLGAPEKQVAQAVSASKAAAPTVQANARLLKQNDQTALELDYSTEQAWRRLGLALDRRGFTVEDRDRMAGLYFVRFVDAPEGKEEPGFWARMFGAKESSPVRVRLSLKASAGNSEKSTVHVVNEAATPVTPAQIDRVLNTLLLELK